MYVYRYGIGAPDKYRDPVCGMRIKESGAKTTYKNETIYFCSQHCKDLFEKNPSGYLHKQLKVSEEDNSSNHKHN